MKKDKILIMFGGISPEYEVSVITGLQVLENIDNKKYSPIPILLTKNGEFKYLRGLKGKKEFIKCRKSNIVFGTDQKGGFVKSGLRKIYPVSAYLAFHGGNGESGEVQGLMQSLNIAITSPSVESCALTMNKNIEKTVAIEKEIPVLESICILSNEIKQDIDSVLIKILKKFKFPLIVKPAHFGSSIGIEIVKDKNDLVRALMSNSLIDDEILIEKFLEEFNEYNCSVMEIEGKIECSNIEKPMKKSKILSFKDKYEDPDSVKKYSFSSGGMASALRELPAIISQDKEEKILKYSEQLYRDFRCKGPVRIDFIEDANGKIFFNEVNQIPGSMSFYLWESKGMSFKEQITNSIKESIKNQQRKRKLDLDYETDIIEKFVNSKDR